MKLRTVPLLSQNVSFEVPVTFPTGVSVTPPEANEKPTPVDVPFDVRAAHWFVPPRITHADAPTTVQLVSAGIAIVTAVAEPFAGWVEGEIVTPAAAAVELVAVQVPTGSQVPSAGAEDCQAGQAPPAEVNSIHIR